MRICGKIIPLGVKLGGNGSTPAPMLQIKKIRPFISIQTMEFKLGKFSHVKVMHFRTYAVFSAKRENNGKTKGFGSFL